MTSTPEIPRSFDVREDEEQHSKLEDCIVLFVAAGYFRARVKGLHAFDKIVGGLAWAIQICNFEADIDIFHDSLSIGQKIALTEKIVETLKQMQCPHSIEPHQIQGLDFIHIYPVVQWLIKQTLEHRASVAQRVRLSGVEQFCRVVTDNQACDTSGTTSSRKLASFCDAAASVNADGADESRKFVRRYYKWTARKAELSTLPDVDDEKLVRMTLLEYTDAARREAVPESTDAGSSPKNAVDNVDAEEFRALLSDGGLRKATLKMKAGKIGSLIAETSAGVIDQLSAEFAAEQERIKEQGGVAAGTPTQKLRILERRAAAHRERLGEIQQREQEMRQKRGDIVATFEAAQTRKQQLEQRGEEIAMQISALSGGKNDDFATIEAQVKQYEDLKRQNQTFKKDCKRRAAEFEAEITALQQQLETKLLPSSSTQRDQAVLQQQLDEARSLLATSRSRLATISRELGAVQRQRDAVPTAAEISQYQRRFIELYEEINTWHRQLRQLYGIFNQCQDSLQFYEKEIGLFDSINDNFRKILDNDDPPAAARARDNLLAQLKETLDSVERNVAGADMALTKALNKRDLASREYAEKLDEQRRYAEMLRGFQRECTRNEQLMAAAAAANTNFHDGTSPVVPNGT